MKRAQADSLRRSEPGGRGGAGGSPPRNTEVLALKVVARGLMQEGRS
jgi:hypothetical protein